MQFRRLREIKLFGGRAGAVKADPNFNTRFVRLQFEQIDPSSRRRKRYWLTWDFTVVGGIPSSFNRLARSSADIF